MDMSDSRVCWNGMRAWWWLLFLAPAAVPDSRQDTALLAQHLRAIRGVLTIPEASYRSLQAEYLAWIDARVKAAESTEAMNQELRAAGLFDALDDTVDSTKSNAGFLGELSTRSVRGSSDLVVVVAGNYGAALCTVDDTAIVYRRPSLTRIAAINATSTLDGYWYHLSGIDVGPSDKDGNRLIATGWTISSCNSAWNGKRIRIDRTNGTTVRNLLARSLNARDRDSEENISASAGQEIVTFYYDGASGESYLLSTSSIARYRISGGRTIRETPIALTRVGFLYEWLRMEDSEAQRWAESAAVERRNASLANRASIFEWEQLARCAGTPPVWELAVRYENGSRLVFRLAGERATDLHMLAITDRLTPTCAVVDLANGISSIAAELPW